MTRLREAWSGASLLLLSFFLSFSLFNYFAKKVIPITMVGDRYLYIFPMTMIETFNLVEAIGS